MMNSLGTDWTLNSSSLIRFFLNSFGNKLKKDWFSRIRQLSPLTSCAGAIFKPPKTIPYLKYIVIIKVEPFKPKGLPSTSLSLF